ncbi:hypothetical protein [Chitinophaga qingshengii]|uniref:YcxB family protein n=1 Tax=Chitinophaga qingshengii TaxID=1569794 RepID=A0ABR7TI67_9BACT|nr:hypothetical protein [Chitinophaga qingshengii]MBC9930211.1 hypothetical protein [Chitinophaga qingshengii]
MRSLQDLQATLTAIHEKDKKQIIQALITAEILATLFMAVVLTSILKTKAELPLLLILMFGAMMIGPVIPYLIMWMQAKKRPSKIEEFVARLRKGEAVSNLETYTDYKLILPLRVIRIRLFPMEYAQIVIGTGRQSYKLPLSEENVQPFRAFVSAAGAGAVTGNTPSANWSAN